MEGGDTAFHYHTLRKGIPPLLPVPVSLGRGLRLVQPFQPGTGPLGKGALRLLRGLRKSMSGRAYGPGSLPLPGMHPLRQVYRGLPYAMPAFFRKTENPPNGGARPYRPFLPSSARRCSFIDSPPPKPTSFPVLPTTLWQGTKIITGLLPQAAPTALAPLGLPTCRAISP